MTDCVLHAKTYYNDPSVRTGDELYVRVDIDRLRAAPRKTIRPGVESMGWSRVALATAHDDDAHAIGGYLQVKVVLMDPIHPNLKGATLTMTASIGYWFSLPTGLQFTPEWYCTMTGTSYTVMATP